MQPIFREPDHHARRNQARAAKGLPELPADMIANMIGFDIGNVRRQVLWKKMSIPSHWFIQGGGHIEVAPRATINPPPPVAPAFPHDHNFESFIEELDARVLDSGSYGLTSILRERYRVLGEGYHAAVVVCPWDETKVLKVGNKPESDGWLEWAAFCIGFKKSNPLVPVIHNLVVKRGFFVALLDRYEDTVQRVLTRDPERVHAERYESLREVFGRMYPMPEARELTGSRAEPEQTFLVHAYRLKEELVRQGLSFTDLHTNNLMFTKDGSIVLTDPIGQSYDSRKKLAASGVHVEH